MSFSSYPRTVVSCPSLHDAALLALACLLGLGLSAKLLIDFQSLRDGIRAPDLSRRLSMTWRAVRTKTDDIDVVTFVELPERVTLELEHGNRP